MTDTVQGPLDNSLPPEFSRVSSPEPINGHTAFRSVFNGHGPYLSWSHVSSPQNHHGTWFATIDSMRPSTS
jgi:hypothetical protein